MGVLAALSNIGTLIAILKGVGKLLDFFKPARGVVRIGEIGQAKLNQNNTSLTFNVLQTLECEINVTIDQKQYKILVKDDFTGNNLDAVSVNDEECFDDRVNTHPHNDGLTLRALVTFSAVTADGREVKGKIRTQGMGLLELLGLLQNQETKQGSKD